MSELKPIPTGPEMQSYWRSNRQAAPAELPGAWGASVLATPFGDSIAPQRTQLAVAKVESATAGYESWMRVRLYLTRDLRYFDFLFISSNDPQNPLKFSSMWFWIDSSVSGELKQIHGPYRTTLQVPGPGFLVSNNASWGNRYPLMCTDRNPKGIDCDHWVVTTPGTRKDHGSWYSIRRDTGHVLRVFTMDSNNPMMLPFLGAYYMANFASFQREVSAESMDLLKAIKAGRYAKSPAYWNPMVTQQDVQRALADPVAFAKCTRKDIQRVLPGFTPFPKDVPLPVWADKTYIEGWTIGVDLIPWFTRVCYKWTGDGRSRENATYLGMGRSGGDGSYFKRLDSCLTTVKTDFPYYEWDKKSGSWRLVSCLGGLSIGLPYPDSLSRSHAVVMGQIKGNADFGLDPDEALNFIASEMPDGPGQLAIFWVWFLENEVGMLFSEAKYIDPFSTVPQLIDYMLFMRDAPITARDLTNPCNSSPKKSRRPLVGVPNVRGGSTRLIHTRKKP